MLVAIKLILALLLWGVGIHRLVISRHCVLTRDSALQAAIGDTCMLASVFCILRLIGVL